jgi:hypothetical protein
MIKKLLFSFFAIIITFFIAQAAFAQSISISPTSVILDGTGYLITVTGTGTSWTPGTPGSPTFTASAGAITAQTVNSATSATLTYSAPGATGSVTITDPSTGATAILTITSLNSYAPNNSDIYYSPGSWVVNGTSSATANNAGAYFKFDFAGSYCNLVLSTSGLGGNATYIRVVTDNGETNPPYTDYNIAGVTTLNIANGITRGGHTMQVYYRGRDVGLDSWNTPSDGLVLTSMQMDGPISMPTIFPNTMIVYGASKIEGYNDLGLDGAADDQDATSTTAFYLAHAFNCELCLSAFGSQGVCVGGDTNVPPQFTVGNDTLSSWDKIYSGQPRVVSGRYTTQYNYIIFADVGTADSNQGVAPSTYIAAVQGLMTAARAAAPNAKIFFNYSYEDFFTTNTQTAYANYQAATPDPNLYLVYAGLTPQDISIWASGASFILANGPHPNLYGQSYVAAGLLNNMLSAMKSGQYISF